MQEGERASAVLDLAIVIVNYNVAGLLRRCLETVLASEGDFSFEVCVVDNASTDESVTMVRDIFPESDFPVRLIANEENVGYPAANNQGLRALGAESDSRLVTAFCSIRTPKCRPMPLPNS